MSDSTPHTPTTADALALGQWATDALGANVCHCCGAPGTHAILGSLRADPDLRCDRESCGAIVEGWRIVRLDAIRDLAAAFVAQAKELEAVRAAHARDLAALRDERGRLRPGQAVFNAIVEVDPAFAETIRGNPALDPFCADDRIRAMLDAWRERVASEATETLAAAVREFRDAEMEFDEAEREHREANLVYAKRLGESALDVASLDVAWNACMDAQSAVTEARRKASKASNVLDALTRVT
jgi:hypothetical protein